MVLNTRVRTCAGRVVTASEVGRSTQHAALPLARTGLGWAQQASVAEEGKLELSRKMTKSGDFEKGGAIPNSRRRCVG